MALLNLESGTGTPGTGLVSAPSSELGGILQILNTIRDISQSPLANVIAEKFMQGNSQVPTAKASTPSNDPSKGKSQEVQAVEPGVTPPEQAHAPQFNEAQLMSILSTPKGREQLAQGLDKVRKTLGADLTISQMVEALRSGKLEQKPKQQQKKQEKKQ